MPLRRRSIIETPRSVDLSLILRGFFATAVVFWHTIGYRLEFPALDSINIAGRLAVWMFFGLSGYVIGYGFFKPRYDLSTRGLIVYILRRAVRILPLFWVATAATLILLANQGRPADVGFRELLALQWQHIDYPVGVFWTLGVELQFYLVAPIIAWAVIAAGRAWPYVVGALWLGLWLMFGEVADDRSMLGNLQHFVTGMAIARLSVEGAGLQYVRRRTIAGLSIMAVIAIAVSNFLYHNGQFWTLRASLASDAAIIAILLLHCAVEQKRFAANTAMVLLMVWGTLAYGIYAWHGVILTVWPDLISNFPLTFALSLVLAYGSYVMFERSSMRIIRQMTSREPEGD